MSDDVVPVAVARFADACIVVQELIRGAASMLCASWESPLVILPYALYAPVWGLDVDAVNVVLPPHPVRLPVSNAPLIIQFWLALGVVSWIWSKSAVVMR